MKYEIHKWSNGIYSPVWVECDGVKIADFGHNNQIKSLQYAELFVEALNSKLHQPTVISSVCELNREPNECSVNLYTEKGCKTCYYFKAK